MRDWGFLFMLLAGSSAIFLGLMDLLYDLKHDMFVPLTTEAAIELIIVLLLLLLGSGVIVTMWRVRRVFFT
jgi:membrane protein DedA with SNARE-associated domain